MREGRLHAGGEIACEGGEIAPRTSTLFLERKATALRSFEWELATRKER